MWQQEPDGTLLLGQRVHARERSVAVVIVCNAHYPQVVVMSEGQRKIVQAWSGTRSKKRCTRCAVVRLQVTADYGGCGERYIRDDKCRQAQTNSQNQSLKNGRLVVGSPSHKQVRPLFSFFTWVGVDLQFQFRF